MSDPAFQLALVGYGLVLLAALQAHGVLGRRGDSGDGGGPESAFCYLLLCTGCALVVIAIGIRPMEIGTDTGFYCDEYAAATSGMWKRGNSEVLYRWLVAAIAPAQSREVLFSVTAAIFVFGFIRAARKLYSGPEVTILFFIWLSTPFFWGLSTNVVRQGLALVFALESLFALEQRRRGAFLVNGALACGFHLSSLFLLMAALVSRRINLRVLLLVWVGAVTLPLITVPGQLLAYAGSVAGQIGLGRYVEEYLLGGPGEYEVGFKARFVIFSAAPILAYCLLRIPAEVRAKTDFLVKTYICMNALACLCFHVAFHDRIFLLSWSLLPFIVYPLIPTGRAGRVLTIAATAAAGVFFTYLAWVPVPS